VPGANVRAALVASCLRGALPPVLLRAVWVGSDAWATTWRRNVRLETQTVRGETLRCHALRRVCQTCFVRAIVNLLGESEQGRVCLLDQWLLMNGTSEGRYLSPFSAKSIES